MAAADRDESSPTSSRECYDLLDLRYCLRPDVKLRAGMEGLCPGVVSVGGRCAEGDGWVELGELVLNERVHH